MHWTNEVDKPNSLRDLGALVWLGLLQIWRCPQILQPAPLGDESIYLLAFERAAAGVSPYQGSYFYLPVFAHAGGFLGELAGKAALLGSLRAANVVAVATIVWLSLRLSRLPFFPRLLVASGFVLVAPVVYYVYLWGNLSAPVVGVVLLGLWLSRRSLFTAGALLGLGVLVKPIAVAALVVLSTHRSLGDGMGPLRGPLALRPSQLALLLLVAPALAAAALLPPHLRGFLDVDQGQFDTVANASLYQLLRNFGAEVPPFSLAASVMVAAAVLGRVRAWRWPEVYGLSVCATLLSLPAVWTHTLLITLPIQVVALSTSWRRWRESSATPSSKRLLEWVLVVGSVLALELSQALAIWSDLPRPVQGLLLLWPVVAPIGLAAYVARWCGRCELEERRAAAAASTAVDQPATA